MNSVDRATLIDFALGRLNDAEAAALARRAEEDSEFAQTLAALRRELASLDEVRPSALFPLSQRASQLSELENQTPLTSAATQDDDVSPDVDDEERDERVVFLAPPSPGAVKVRRIGPVYPYYSEDGDETDGESSALQAPFPSSCKPFAANDEETQVNEEAQTGEETQIDEEAQISEEAQVDEEPQFGEESQIDEESQIGEETQVGEEAQVSEETQIGEETQVGEEAQIGEETQDSLNAPNKENTPFIQEAPSSRFSRRFHFIPKFIASTRDAQSSPFVAKRARRLDATDAPTSVSPNPAPRALHAPKLEVQCDVKERFVDAQAVAPPPFDPSALPPAERRLAELLGRRPSSLELDEYYWETIAETAQVEYESEKRASRVVAAVRLTTNPVVAVGRATLAICGAGRRSALGSDAFAATKPSSRRQPSKISDMMISTISGVLIAVVVVFPLMRLAVKEVFTTIAKSAVRKIGVNVSVSKNAPQSDVFPLISEQLVFPHYSESTALQPFDGESGTHAETSAFGGLSTDDPASTPPTLEPVPSAVDAPFLPPRNAQE